MCSVRLVRRPTRTETIETVYAENFERVPEAASLARRLVVHALDMWELPHLCDVAELVLTELVSNAVKHARGEGMRVNVVRLDERRVQVSVLDRDTTRPQVQDQDPAAERGRGLMIVSVESAAWGVELLPGGKRVWAVLEAGAA